MLTGMLMLIGIYTVTGVGGILLGVGAGYWFAKTRDTSILTGVLVGGLTGLVLAEIAATLGIFLLTQ